MATDPPVDEATTSGARCKPLVVHGETLDLNADCAEFCPVPGLTHLLALGTYQLREETQCREGRCYLRALRGISYPSSARGQGPSACSSVAGDAPGSIGIGGSVGIDLPGIFDLKWAPAGTLAASGGTASEGRRRAVLGAALADGTVRLLDASAEQGCDACDSHCGLELLEVARTTACGGGGMSLSLDWQGAGAGGDAYAGADAAGGAGSGGGFARIAASSSSGTLSLLEVAEGRLTLLSEWEAHTLEVWCTAFHRAQPQLVFSGADDCAFKVWDTRADPDSGASAAPVFTDRRTHGAGVCTVSPHPTQTHLVATGSYDEKVRLWDTRNTARPVVVSQVDTGGGNWRLRWHPHDPHVMLAACMYNGFAVLRASEDWAGMEVVATYSSPNKHIGYGADWWQGGRQGCSGAGRAEGPTAAWAESGGVSGEGGGAEAADGGDGGQGGEGNTGTSDCWLAATCSFYDQHHTLVWLPTRV